MGEILRLDVLEVGAVCLRDLVVCGFLRDAFFLEVDFLDAFLCVVATMVTDLATKRGFFVARGFDAAVMPDTFFQLLIPRLSARISQVAPSWPTATVPTSSACAHKPKPFGDGSFPEKYALLSFLQEGMTRQEEKKDNEGLVKMLGYYCVCWDWKRLKKLKHTS